MELHRSRLAVALALVAIVFPTTFSGKENIILEYRFLHKLACHIFLGKKIVVK